MEPIKPRPLSHLHYVFRLKAFRALTDFKFDELAFVQRLISVHLDGGKVNENILPGLALNETVPLCCVEPLHHTLFSSQRSLLLQVMSRFGCL